MPSSFPRTLRAIEAEGPFGWVIRVLALTALLAAWLVWFLRAEVPVLAVSDEARLEVSDQVHPVQAPVDGRITRVAIELDAEVGAGQVLVELEAAAERGTLDEETARLAGLRAQLEAKQSELAIARRALEETVQGIRARLDETAERLREATSAAELAEEEAERLMSLRDQGLVSEMELLRAQADANQRRSAAETLRLTLARERFELGAEEGARRAQLEDLNREEAELTAQVAAAEAVLGRVEQDLERRRIRAPVAGRLGEVSNLQVGSFVSAGDRLATVVPEGEIRAVAMFQPPVALGRVRRGQPARLRLAGFPSLQYGTVAASVARVASEARQGLIRVDLEVEPGPAGGAPLRHGLPGTVEVEVERCSPLELVLRAVGKILDRPSSAAATAAGTGR